jgi:endonuclease/exonuclease/phosphatase (EEP) superfamily protein YafD
LNPATPPRPAMVRKLFRPAAWTLAIVALVQPIATWAAWSDGKAELVSHFREPAMVASVLASVAMARVRRWLAVGLGLVALCQGIDLSRYEWSNPVRPDPGSPERLRVLMANVLVQNADREGLIRLIRRERPDVVGLIEVSEDWLAGLEPVRSEYPHRFESPEETGRGIALWFRERPLSVEPASPLVSGGNPAFHATITFAGSTRHLWLVHNTSPFEKHDDLPPGGELAALADRIRREGGSTLVVGDLNTTEGSPRFGQFLQDSGLRESRFGFGRQPSWPSWSWYRIAIDHAFLSNDLAVESRRIGPAIGSDHFPMLLEVAPADHSSRR